MKGTIMNLRTVRKKIKSVKNVRKITKAMQLISAVKMKKAVQNEVDGRVYRDGLTELISSLSGKVDTSLSPLLMTPKGNVERDLIIYVSANKGLCGAFHVNLLKFILKNIDLKKSEFVTIGSKGAQTLSKFDREIIADYSVGAPQTKVSAIFELALNSFLEGKYRTIQLLYTQYISALRSEIKLVNLLPISVKSPDSQHTTHDSRMSQEYIVEPSPQKLVDALLRSAVEEQIRGAVISSEAVEHSMRMMAMKGATDNAGDVIYSLTLVGNKIRQTKITNELLDMVTAKVSVEMS
jgi:F-type H+-transporting ATPase subunit gamma